MRNQFLLSLVALCLLSPEFSVAQGRRWEQPKGVPLFDLRHTITTEEAKAQQGVVRSYLWHLWKTRTKGSFHVRTYSIEGDPTNCRYFVEPGKVGRWQVVSKCQGSVCPYISKAQCGKYLQPYVTTYDMLERRESGYNDPKSAPSVPDNQSRGPLAFILVLTNSASGELMVL